MTLFISMLKYVRTCENCFFFPLIANFENVYARVKLHHLLLNRNQETSTSSVL